VGLLDWGCGTVGLQDWDYRTGIVGLGLWDCRAVGLQDCRSTGL
jgi:hypothetical protein